MGARPAVAMALSLVLAACSGDRSPVWIDLADGSVAPGLPEPGTRSLGEDRKGTSRTVLAVGEGAAWIETSFRRGAWRPETFDGGAAGVWAAVPGHTGLSIAPPGQPAEELTAAAGPLPPMEGDLSARPWFYRLAGRVLLGLEPGEEPPSETLFRQAATPARRAPDGGWEILGRRFFGRGLPVWPGESTALSLPVPPGSALRFATVAETSARESGGAPYAFWVELDGERIFEHRETPSSYAWHEVPLPPEGREDARLVLGVDDGPLAFTSFCAPRVGPSDAGGYGARPWGRSRPDVVVLLADTFRADNVGAYGGEHGLTPNLDRFAEESLCFLRAWSTSTFTLPAHASLFTGLFPRQAGADRTSRRLHEDFEVVAEILQRRGYRTGAITDSGYVSALHGLAQGFEWFDQYDDGLDSTLERVRRFLAADDGRPIFLFVQTYETHMPYEVSEETRREHAAVLGLAPDEDAELYETATAASGPEIADRLRRLYLGTVADLDRAFGGLRAELEALGIWESGYVVFTSDHGEAFLEHGELFHGGKAYEEQLRVPLLVHGPGVAPRRATEAASLVDLHATIADMAGVEPAAGQIGRSLLDLDVDRPVLAFDCREGESTVALVDGPRKVIGFEGEEGLRPDLFAAFHLGRDPAERVDLLEGPRPPAWAEELAERLDPAVREALVPGREAQAHATAEHREELRALGYVDR